MQPAISLLVLGLLFTLTVSESHDYGHDDSIPEDPLGYDPRLEIVHLFRSIKYVDGIGVSRSGRKFSCYPAAFFAQNTNNGHNNAYQVVELIGLDRERPYPSAAMNNPPGGSIDYTQNPPVTKGLPNYLLGVDATVVDYNDILWILDSGRVLLNKTQLPASPGGTKLISVDLTTDTVIRTYTFPTTVAKPNSYFDDVRIDTKHQFAYISDFSDATRDNAIVVLDLKSGKSRRVLERDPTVLAIVGTVPFIIGQPIYQQTASGETVFSTLGVNGIALSNDTETLYYSVVTGRFLYSVPTYILRDWKTLPAKVAASVRNLGEKGTSDSMVTDSTGTVFAGNNEQSGVSMYDPTSGKTVLFVRDRRICWIAALSVGEDRYLYLTVSQANFQATFHYGIEDRRPPFVVFRVRLPGVATKGLGS